MATEEQNIQTTKTRLGIYTKRHLKHLRPDAYVLTQKYKYGQYTSFKASHPVAIGPKKRNLSKSPEKDFKIKIANIFKDLKEL